MSEINTFNFPFAPNEDQLLLIGQQILSDFPAYQEKVISRNNNKFAPDGALVYVPLTQAYREGFLNRPIPPIEEDEISF